MQFLEHLTATVRRSQHSDGQSPAFPPARAIPGTVATSIPVPAVEQSLELSEPPGLTQEDLLLLTKKLSRKLANTQRRYGVISQQCEDYTVLVSQLMALILDVTGHRLEDFVQKAAESVISPPLDAAPEMEPPSQSERVRSMLSALLAVREGPVKLEALKSSMVTAHVADIGEIHNSAAPENDSEALRKSYETQIRKLSKEFSIVEDRHIAKQQELAAEIAHRTATINRLQQELLVASNAACTRCAATLRLHDTAQTLLHLNAHRNRELSLVVQKRMIETRTGFVEFVSAAHNDLDAFHVWISTMQHRYDNLCERNRLAHSAKLSESASLPAAMSPRTFALTEEIDRLHKDSASRSSRSIALLAEKEAQIAALQTRLQQHSASVVNVSDPLLIDELKEITSQLTLSRNQEVLLKDVIRDLQQQLQVCTSLISPINVTYLRNVTLQLIALTNSLPLSLSTKAQRESLARVIATILNFDADECRRAGCPTIVGSPSAFATSSPQQRALRGSSQSHSTPTAPRDPTPGMYDVNLVSPPQVGKPRRIIDVDGLGASGGHII
jgi:hypothetical protein